MNFELREVAEGQSVTIWLGFRLIMREKETLLIELVEIYTPAVILTDHCTLFDIFTLL